MAKKKRRPLVKFRPTRKIALESVMRLGALEARFEQLEMRESAISGRVTDMEGTVQWMRQLATIDKETLRVAKKLAQGVLAESRISLELIKLADEVLAFADR